MIFLDAYGLVAFLADEPAAGLVESLLSEQPGAVVGPNLVETVYVLHREHDVPPARARVLISRFPSEMLTVVPFTEAHSWRAGELRVTWYHGRKRPLSLADCALIAAAEPEDAIATADPHVLAVAEAEGIEAIKLPTRD